MNNVYNRVAIWNSRRYDREYNHALTVALLKEEFQEWLDAATAVDKLDALCDEVYVALGAIWKLNADDTDVAYYEERAQLLYQAFVEHLDEPHYGYTIAMHLAVLEYEQETPVLLSLHLVIKAAVCEMLGMGLSMEQVEKALLIVCDANDSKSIKKVNSAVKANDGDKGPLFKSPEPLLANLLEEASNGTLSSM